MVVLVAVTGIALARSRSEGCRLPPPLPDLPTRLRAIGDFDRPFNVGVGRDLEDLSSRAAAALYPNLIGTVAERPVRVMASSADHHDALVVPLTLSPLPNGPSHLGGLVSFLLDCSGRAYYSAVQDLSTTVPTVPTFPRITAATAWAQLGGRDVRLVYRDSPFQPAWRDPKTGAELPAG